MTYFSFILFTIFSSFSLQDPWIKEVDKNGVQVYTRSVKNYPIKAFKATSTIDANPDQILEVLFDIKNYSEWVANCRATTILRKDSETRVYFYLEIDAPFPVADRDLVQSAELSKINIYTTELIISNHPDMIESKKGMVRMPKSDGKWTIKMIDDSRSFVQLEMMNDPGGSLPNWLVNAMITGSPFKTMSNLRNKFAE